MSERPHVRLDEATNTYVLEVGGTMAGYAEFRVVDETIREFNHTVVLEDYRGQGLSEPLIRYALDDSIREGFSIQPTCSAVAHMVEKHPEYAKHIAARQ